MSSTLAFSIEEALRRDGVPVVLSLAEASRVTRHHPEVLQRLCRRGVIEAVRTPTPSGATGRWRVTRASIATYLAGHAPRQEAADA